MPLVVYTATGGVEFVVQAWLLARRRRRVAQPGGPLPERKLTGDPPRPTATCAGPDNRVGAARYHD
jgi:hypothetical protein